jgi:PAS domain S-box-containing protein
MEEQINFMKELFNTDDWPARWRCGVWSDFHGWLYILSDLAIWFAYFAIPVILIWYIYKNNLRIFKRIFILFSLFIFACGSTHLIDAIIFWKPVYRISALARLNTAVISWVTVFAMIKVMPRYLQFKSPELLEAEIEQRRQSETELKQIKESLEISVQKRTSALELMNLKLQEEIKIRNIREETIRENEEKFRSLVESSPNAIILTDHTGVIQLINRQAEILFGHGRSEMVSHSIEKLIPQEYRENHPAYRKQFYKHPDRRPMGMGRDLYALHSDGHKIPVEIGLTPIYDKGNMMVLSTIVDITERKRVEENIRQKNVELERSHSELQSKTAQLIQSEKMSALGVLVAGVAHELNNPLTGILNYTQYCQKHTGKDSKLHPVLDDLLEEARRCADIVKNLLTYAHTSDVNEEPVTHNIGELIDRIARLFKHLLEDIHFRFDIAHDLPSFRINPNKLQQVLMNLIKNGIDALEGRDRKQITVSATFDNKHCYISIEDNGIGIKEENLSKIFDPFYTTKEVGKGTGLGLSVSKSIIDEYEGRIECNSRELEGTAIRLRFNR